MSTLQDYDKFEKAQPQWFHWLLYDSTLEARWALWFNMAGIEYIVKPCCGKYIHGKSCYNIDFGLPSVYVDHPDGTSTKGLYVEVKSTPTLYPEGLRERIEEFVKTNGKNVTFLPNMTHSVNDIVNKYCEGDHPCSNRYLTSWVNSTVYPYWFAVNTKDGTIHYRNAMQIDNEVYRYPTASTHTALSAIFKTNGADGGHAYDRSTGERIDSDK